ncbi:MAG: hypothetical protein ACRC46_07485 [Thermoguttaceae bacterium]
MPRFLLQVSGLLVLVFLFGCSGGGAAVSGKITFPDGTPLTTGRVVFETATQSFTGYLNESGKYNLMGATASSGLPPGKYRVSVVDAVQAPSSGAPVQLDGDGNPINYKPNDAPSKPLVAAKFTQATTSGLECEVKGRTVFDITVEKP